MRDLKFRLVDPKSKKVVAYVTVGKDYGYTLEAVGNGIAFNMSKVDWYQYIGRLDRNNAEIYEGDILQVRCYSFSMQKLEDPEIYAVEYGRHNGFILHNKSSVWPWIGFDESDMSVYQIIGNIYENKELLNG